MTEQWKSAPGFPGYEVSNLGNVRSYQKQGAYPGLEKRPHMLCPGHTNGYEHVNLSKNRRSCSVYVHRLVLLAFEGPCPEGQEACHNNGVRHDNRLLNLRYDTPTYNVKDAIEHGRRPPRKLTPRQVRAIRHLRGQGHSYYAIAKHFPVTSEAIREVCTGRAYKDIT